MLINTFILDGLIKTYRICWLDGRYGSGKSALAHMIAYNLLSTGVDRYLVENCPSIWRDVKEDVVPDALGRLNACIVLDEAGLFLETAREAKKFQAALRKLNCHVIMPSISPPSSRIKFLRVQRVFSADPWGLPLWIYSVTVNSGDIKEKDYFGWWKPSEIFGIYSTQHFPTSDCGLAAWLEEYVKLS